MGNKPGKSGKKQDFGGGQATGYRTDGGGIQNLRNQEAQGQRLGGSAPARPGTGQGARPVAQPQIQQTPSAPRFTGGGVLGHGTSTSPASGGNQGMHQNAPSPALTREQIAARVQEMNGLLDMVSDAPPDMLVPALELLQKMFTAIIEKPSEPKVRRIRWLNEKVQKHLGGVPVAMDFLQCAGFSVRTCPVENGEGDEEVLLFEEGASMTLLSEARKCVIAVLSKAKAAAAQEPPPLVDLSIDPQASASHVSPQASPQTAGSPVVSKDQSLDDSSKPAASVAAAPSAPSQPAVTSTATDEDRLIQHLYGLASSTRGADPEALLPAYEVLIKISSGIIEQPSNPKLRRIKKSGNTFQKVAKFESLITMLSVAGFEFSMVDGEEYATFPDGLSLSLLSEMRGIVEQEARRIRPFVVGAQGSNAPNAPAPEFDRQTRVFKKGDAHVDPARFEVPDAFFEVTQGDIKASVAAAQQKNMLMTKTMREALKPKYKLALIRIRFPDGHIIQGTFRPKETMAAVKKWVESLLATPDRLFHLSTMPPVKKVSDSKMIQSTLQDLDLVPATLLNFFWEDGMSEGSLTRDLMARAEVLVPGMTALPDAEVNKPSWAQTGTPQGASGGSDKTPKWMQKR